MKTIEDFIREHLDKTPKDFVMTISLDPVTSKVVGAFHDKDPDGGIANFRVEGNAVILQSWDTALEKKAQAEKAAEEKKMADEAEADRADTKRRLSGQKT